MLLSQNLFFEAATEPSNIIWEHQESDDTSWCKNKITGAFCRTQFVWKLFAFSMITLFVCIMFAFFWWMK